MQKGFEYIKNLYNSGYDFANVYGHVRNGVLTSFSSMMVFFSKKTGCVP